MSYSNITVVTAQGTFGYQPSDPFVPISYNTLDLIQDIPHNAQLEVERIFSIDRNGDTNAIPNFLNDTNVAIVDKQRVFIIPTGRITYNITTKQITDVLLPSSGEDVFDYAFTYISGPNAGQQGSIAVPQLRLGDNIIIRRKTVSNTPLVLWTAGSKLTTAQLNLNTTQLLYLVQELNNKITITSVSTEQILDNAITTPKILNGAVTSDKLFDLGGPKRLLGSGNVTANADGLYDVQEITLGNGFYWDENSTVLEVADIETGTKGDINIIVPRTNWRIVDNAVTYTKMQDITASRLLGRGSSGSGDPQELTVANNLTISGTQLGVTTPLTDGNKGDVDVSNNGTVFNLTNNSVDTAQITDRSVTYGKIQNMSAIGNRVLGTVAGSEPPQEVQVNTNMLAAAAVTNAKLAASAVDANNIQSNAVTTEKLQNNAVTYEKMRTVATANRVLGSTSANNMVSEVQINTNMVVDNAVSFAKMQQIASGNLLGRAASGTGNVELIAITAAGRNLIDENSVADMRQYLELGTAALSSTADFAPATHTHGNLSSDGKIGSTSGLPLITGTSGAIQTGTFGTTAGTFCVGNDARLSDARTPVAHTHPISDVTNLQTSLDAKSNVGHGHVIGDVSGLQTALDGKAASSHTHTISQVTNLQTALDGKAALSHSHSISDVTNLQTNLDNKSNVGHTHVIADVTGLQTALDGKAASSHTHAIGDVTGLQTALDGKAATSHTHTLANITDAGSAASKNVPAVGVNATTTQVVMGDDTRLTNARTPTAHTHVISDVTNLQTTLDGKAASSHTHSTSDITSGTLAVARGGTGVSTTPTSGQLLIGDNTGFTLATITAGTNIAISNTAGGITISQVGEPQSPDLVLEDGTYGDITVSGATWTIGNNAISTAKIANDAVTFDKIQNIATDRLLGRATAGNGSVEEITLTAAGRNLLDDADAAAQRTTLGLGSAALVNVPSTGDATSAQAVLGNDTRLTNARTPVAHTHAISDITNLQTALDSKVDDSQITTFALTLLDDANAATMRTTLGLGTAATQASTAFAAASHTHAIADVTGLQTELNNKAALSHTHAIANVTGLQDALDGKAATSHTHTIANVTGLQTELNNKLNSSAVSAYMLTVLDDANAAAAQSTLGLGSAATRADSYFALAGHTHGTTGLNDGAVTYAKMQNVATANRLLGSATANAPVSEVQVQTGMVTDSAITAAKLATDSVTTAKIADVNVTTAKLANGAVTSDKIANGAVTYAKLPTIVTANRLLGSTTAGGTVGEVQITAAMLADGLVTTAKIADGNVTAAKLASGVAAANLGNLGVTTALLADNAVTTIKITDLNVTTGKLANNAVTYGKMQVVATGNRLLGSTTAGGAVSEVQVATDMVLDSAITTAKVNNAAITADKLATNAVTTAKILDRNVTFPKLPASVTANRVLGATTSGTDYAEVQVNTNMIADGAITAAKIASGAITFSASDLADGSITANKLATDSVTEVKIQNAAVTNAKISNRAGNSVMGRSASTAGSVADITPTASGQVLRYDGTTTGFGTVGTAGIADGAITTAKIGDAQVTGAKILDGEITTNKIANNQLVGSHISSNFTDTQTTSLISTGTTVTLTSQTSVTTSFSIPVWAKQIYIRFEDVLLGVSNGHLCMRVIAGSTEITSLYVSAVNRYAHNQAVGVSTASDKFLLGPNAGANSILAGMATVSRFGATGTLNLSGISHRQDNSNSMFSGNIITATLTNQPISLKFYNTASVAFTNGRVYIAWE